MSKTSITCISDTHCQHRELNLKGGDILIHAGDILNFSRNYKRTLDEMEDFLQWLSEVPYTHKVFIGGNHDLILDTNIYKEDDICDLLASFDDGGNDIHYLCDNTIELNTQNHCVKIYGNPATGFKGMAFENITAATYDNMPSDLDILVTHTPPYGILDNKLGSKDLLNKLETHTPLLHVFGHIHECPGIMIDEKNVTFINAAIGEHLENLPINISLA
jgi:Icc-related predicted phosphoesterase